MADFTTVITADLTESDELMSVASNEGARTTYPWRAVIEDEAIYVNAGVVEGLVWEVRRGADDTDPALHLAGSLLTAVGVGQSITNTVLLIADDVIPPMFLTTEDGTDWLRADPEVSGV